MTTRSLHHPWLIVALLTTGSLAPAMSAIGDETSRDSLKLPADVRERCLRVLQAGVRSDQFWPSMHAAEGLTLGGHGDEVLTLLTDRVAREDDDQRRCGLARECVRAGDRSPAAAMLKILAGEDDYGHIHAAESLYKVNEIGDGVAMRAAMAAGKPPKLRLMAAAALARAGSPSAMQLLRQQLTDDDPEVAQIASWILGRIGDKSDIPQIRKNAQQAPDALKRAYHHHALAALGDAEGLAALAANLSSSDPAIRTYAATFAGDAWATSVGDRLIKLLDDDNLDVRVRTAQSLLVLSRPAPPDPREDISSLVYPSTPDNPRYTEGDVEYLADGSLLFAVTEFSGSGSDFAKARIVARRSTDGGRTWSDSRVLQENTGQLNVMSVSLQRIRPTNKLALFYLQKNAYNNLHVFVRFSDDEGQTFGEATRVTTEAGYHVMNNDRVTQLSSGRLLAPVAFTQDVQKVNHFVSYCYLSDDGGVTWRRGKGHVDAPKRGAMEPQTLELNDGRVMMIMRTQLGHVAVAHSSDGGDTWTSAEPLSVKAPEAPATLRRIPATGDLLLIWNNTYKPGAGHGGKRTPLTAAISTDEGVTWNDVRNLETDEDRTYSYASVTFAGSRTILTYWDNAATGRYSCRFRSLPTSWFYQPAATED